MGQKIIQVNETTYCIYTPSYYNCTYIIKNEEEIFLIDTGLKSNGNDVKKAFKTLNLDIRKIKAILLTHWHNDHAAGTAKVKEWSNCLTIAHELEIPYFELKQSNPLRRIADLIPERGLLILFKGLIGDTVPKKVKIDRSVKNGDNLFKRFEVIETPGHTDGHVSYYDSKTKTLFAGDSLAVVNDILRLMARPVTPNKPVSIKSILNSLNHRNIKHICPGHRQPLSKNVEPEIKRFTEFIQKMNKWPLFG